MMRNAVALRHDGEIEVCKKYRTDWRPTYKTEESMMNLEETQERNGMRNISLTYKSRR